MNEFNFNNLLVKLYHNAMKLEEVTLKLERNVNLTFNEMCLLECIKGGTKYDEGPTISTIAAQMDITRPSATVAIKKLAAKKFVEKIGCSNDGRSVRVKLTNKGEKAFNMHRKYHKSLIDEMNSTFGEDEMNNIRTACDKLNCFFAERAEKAEAEIDDNDF